MVVAKRMRRLVSGISVGTLLVLSGCAFIWEESTTFRAPVEMTEVTSSVWAPPGSYGTEADVRGTVDVVKAIGDISEIGSHAIRLPSHPLSSITTFEYAFPETCGGHRFRVYEAGGTQILEYAYAPREGKSYFIRDYVAGPSPFIQAGLWSAYDHTGDSSVPDMRVQFAKRGSGILKGTYSQGPVTGLDASSRRVLGAAYDRALHDLRSCRRG